VIAAEINGIAHVMLTVRDFARARAFYAWLLPALGLEPLVDSPEHYYCVGEINFVLGKALLGSRSLPAEPS
jgi:catechol 2,3-dioxygenase-like lactoylglutathione lyase family enzyme